MCLLRQGDQRALGAAVIPKETCNRAREGAPGATVEPTAGGLLKGNLGVQREGAVANPFKQMKPLLIWVVSFSEAEDFVNRWRRPGCVQPGNKPALAGAQGDLRGIPWEFTRQRENTFQT